MRKLTKQRRISAAAQLISAFVFATRIVQSLFFLEPNTKFLAVLCECTGRFVSDLVGNPEDRFSSVAAQLFMLATIKDMLVRLPVKVP